MNFASGHRYIVALRNLKDAGGADDPGARRASATTATSCPRTSRRSTPARALRGGSSRPCATPASSARTSTWPGTSRSPATRTSPSACCTCATTRSRPLGDTTSPTGVVQGDVAELHRSTRVDRLHRGPGSARSPAGSSGTFTVPCYLDAELRARAGRFAPATPNGLPTRKRHTGRRTSTASSRAPRSTGRRRRSARRSTGTGCSAPPPRSQRRHPAATSRTPRLHPLRDRRDRDVERATSATPPAILADLSQVPAARRPAAAGPAGRALPRPADDRCPSGFASDPRLPRRRHPGTQLGDRHQPSSTTTATARAGSWAAR